MERSKLKTVRDKFQALHTLRGNEKFRYCIQKNLEMISSHERAFGMYYQKVMSEVPGAEDYNKAYRMLTQSHTKKEGEKYVIDNGRPVIADQQAYQTALAELNENHKEYLEANEKANKLLTEYAKEDIDIQFHKLREEDIPELRSLADDEIIHEFLIQRFDVN